MAVDALREPDRPGRRSTPDPSVPANDARFISAGQAVFTADGDELGIVDEIATSHFRVSVPRGGDIWLDADQVAECTSDRLILRFRRDELDAHALEQPAPADSLISPAEQLAQRRAMEAELAEQHEELPPGAPHSPYHVRKDS
jgi:hypothetical protein